MQAAKRRFRVDPLLWTAAGLILLVAVLLAVLYSGAWPLRYRRFVSQPLPDGTRYTFLYPAHLQNIQENGKGASPEVTQSATVWTMNQSESQWDLLRRQWGFPVMSPAESVSVVVIPLKKKVKDSRRSERWTRGGQLRHNEHIIDARTCTQFSLYHSCPQAAASQFERYNPTIVKSFRVLPPDAGTDLQ